MNSAFTPGGYRYARPVKGATRWSAERAETADRRKNGTAATRLSFLALRERERLCGSGELLPWRPDASGLFALLFTGAEFHLHGKFSRLAGSPSRGSAHRGEHYTRGRSYRGVVRAIPEDRMCTAGAVWSPSSRPSRIRYQRIRASARLRVPRRELSD